LIIKSHLHYCLFHWSKSAKIPHVVAFVIINDHVGCSVCDHGRDH
jgi:hypothetical protein